LTHRQAAGGLQPTVKAIMSSISEMHYKAREYGYYLIKHRLSGI